jgi:hypothetical protein
MLRRIPSANWIAHFADHHLLPVKSRQSLDLRDVFDLSGLLRPLALPLGAPHAQIIADSI